MVVVVRGIDGHVEQIGVEQRKGAHSGTKPDQTRGFLGVPRGDNKLAERSELQVQSEVIRPRPA